MTNQRQIATSSGKKKQVENEEWLKKFAGQFPAQPQYLIPVLQLIQSEVGYLSHEAMRSAAQYLKVPESKVFGVASFYAQFHFSPRGRNTLTICRGTACHVRGSGRLLQEMEKYLEVKPGQATSDMTFSLETVACFGACALAPVAVINDQVHRQQTQSSLRTLVQHVRSQTVKETRDAMKPRGAVRSKPKPKQSPPPPKKKRSWPLGWPATG